MILSVIIIQEKTSFRKKNLKKYSVCIKKRKLTNSKNSVSKNTYRFSFMAYQLSLVI